MKGDEPISINWSLKGDVISSDPQISTTMLGTRTSMLTISSVSHRHIGTYTCRATNPGGSVTHTATLNVNGKYHTIEGTGNSSFFYILFLPDIDTVGLVMMLKLLHMVYQLLSN